jgi:hypothetical protein
MTANPKAPPRKAKHVVRCRTKFCRGLSWPNGHSPYCSRCRSRRFKEAHPLKYSFGKLRARAKERGHAFGLTFEDYHTFAIQTGYDKLKGKTRHSLSINRKQNHLGYTRDNIEAVSLSLNSRIAYSNMPAWMIEDMKREEAASRQAA